LKKNGVCNNGFVVRKLSCESKIKGFEANDTNQELFLSRWRGTNDNVVRIDGFKLDGGELFKENFRKLLKQE